MHRKVFTRKLFAETHTLFTRKRRAGKWRGASGSFFKSTTNVLGSEPREQDWRELRSSARGSNGRGFSARSSSTRGSNARSSSARGPEDLLPEFASYHPDSKQPTFFAVFKFERFFGGDCDRVYSGQCSMWTGLALRTVRIERIYMPAVNCVELCEPLQEALPALCSKCSTRTWKDCSTLYMVHPGELPGTLFQTSRYSST